jgi:hypothetical protein
MALLLFELPDPLQLDLGRQLTKFHLFPYPGPELRVMVWYLNLSWTTQIFLFNHLGRNCFGTFFLLPLPISLQICRESCFETLKHYDLILNNSKHIL